MSAASPMKRIVSIGHRPHPIDSKRYGQPRLALYWASPKLRFTKPGVWLWTGARNVRIVPWGKQATS